MSEAEVEVEVGVKVKVKVEEKQQLSARYIPFRCYVISLDWQRKESVVFVGDLNCLKWKVNLNSLLLALFLCVGVPFKRSP